MTRRTHTRSAPSCRGEAMADAGGRGDNYAARWIRVNRGGRALGREALERGAREQQVEVIE